MGWYDWFSSFYDSSLEALYADARAAAADGLSLSSAERVLDLPVGTGQSLGPLLERLDPSATVVGVDLSAGMVDKARARAERSGWGSRVELVVGDVHTVEVEGYDRLHVFLGMTAFPRHEEAFERLWAGLAPGGRAAVVDVYAEKPGFQGKMVNLVARADITRRAWEPLERLAEGFERVALPPNPKYGGELWLATGRKPS
ncbi:MAG: class I SAM-dependent methyltransferase [Sandaracinaceae bacterium]|nr:class I SAM-dependent methyltransferase [Sandaracinaceae bacterium]